MIASDVNAGATMTLTASADRATVLLVHTPDGRFNSRHILMRQTGHHYI